MQVLLDTKKEYTEHLLDLFTIPIAKKIYKIYNDVKMDIKIFQKELINIKSWNNNKVKEEYDELIKKTKCKYLDKLLEKIILIDIKLKIDNNAKFDKSDIDIIKPYDFIHKCLVNISIYCWKNVYLFSTKNLKASEKQYHLNLIEKNIRKIIKNTIRDVIPYEKILDLYEEQKKQKSKKGGKKEESEPEEGTEEGTEEEIEEGTEENTDLEPEEGTEEEPDEETKEDKLLNEKWEQVKVDNIAEPQRKIKVNEYPLPPPKLFERQKNLISNRVKLESSIDIPKEEVIQISKEEKSDEETEEEINEGTNEETNEIQKEDLMTIPDDKPIEQETKEEEPTEMTEEESEEESDEDFIDPSTFKGLNKKKTEELSSDYYTSSSSSESEDDNKPVDENIKRINLNSIKKLKS